MFFRHLLILDALGSVSHSLADLNEGFFFSFVLSIDMFFKAGIDECRKSELGTFLPL